jgi:hypothetical protein
MVSNPNERTTMNTSPKHLAIGSLVAGLVTLGGVGLANAQTSDAGTDDASATTAVVDVTTDDATEETTVDGGSDRPQRTEEELTGDLATQVTEAALAAVPGGTVERVETDDDGAVYEAHMTTAEGDRVAVTFDAGIQVVEIQEGGAGCGDGDGGGPRPETADDADDVSSEENTTADS